MAYVLHNILEFLVSAVEKKKELLEFEVKKNIQNIVIGNL